GVIIFNWVNGNVLNHKTLRGRAIMSSLQQKSSDFMHCQLFYVNEAQQAQIASLKALVVKHQLPIVLNIELFSEKLNQKRRQQLSQHSIQPILVLDEKDK